MSDEREHQEAFRALAEDKIREAREIGRMYAARCRDKGLAVPDDNLAAEFIGDVAELIFSLPEHYRTTLKVSLEREALGAWASAADSDDFNAQVHAAVATARKAKP